MCALRRFLRRRDSRRRSGAGEGGERRCVCVVCAEWCVLRAVRRVLCELARAGCFECACVGLGFFSQLYLKAGSKMGAAEAGNGKGGRGSRAWRAQRK